MSESPIALPYSFYARDTHTVARDLLGKILVRTYGEESLTGRITEVESYIGEDDLACHASKGRTPRTEIMFGPPGHAYIYLIYGMYNCFNVVTEQEGFPAAVLIRALQPISGIKQMIVNRNGAKETNLMNGPGKLCQALNIDRTMNGGDLTDENSELFIHDDGFKVAPSDIQTSARIGVEYAGEHALLPWRYFLQNLPHSK